MDSLASALDLVAALKAEDNFGPVREALERAGDREARAVLMLVADRQIRPEHRQRIYKDLVDNRDYLLERQDARIVDLVYWSEHVGTLYRALRARRLNEFHYARALEATCRRCGFDLLPAVGRMDELGKYWSGADYRNTVELLSPRALAAEPSDGPQAQA